MTKISSKTTVIWKYISPGLWIPFMGLVLIGRWSKSADPNAILFVLGWIIVSGYLVWFARRLKSVSIDENHVYVSQFRSQIQIPLAHIQRVKESFWASPKLITLTLNHPSEFGTKIVFIPTGLVFAGVRSHPVVQEIERAIKRRRFR